MPKSDIAGVYTSGASRTQEAASLIARGPEEHVADREAYPAKGLELCEYRTDGRRLLCKFHKKEGTNISYCGRGKEACPLD